MNKRDLVRMLDRFQDEDEIKVVKKKGEDTIKLVLIPVQQAEAMNEALGIEPDQAPVEDFISIEEAHTREMQAHENFPDIQSNVVGEDEEDEIPDFVLQEEQGGIDAYDEDRDLDEEQGFINRELGLEGEDSNRNDIY